MSKFIFIIAIFIILFSAFTMLTNHQGLSVKVLVIYFWVLLAGCILYLLEAYEE